MPTRPSAHPNRILGALTLAALAYTVSQTMLMPSLPDIEETFNATPSQVTILMSSFWVAGAVTAGIFGRLGDMFGKRLLLVIVMVVFSAGAVLCALAPSLGIMVGGRVLMGCGVGLFPLAYSLIRDELPSGRVPGAIGLVAGMLAGGAALGQSTGGIFTDLFGFRSIFWVGLALGLASILAILALVPESDERPGGRVDIAGALLFAAGIAAPLTAIAATPSWGWTSARTLAFFAAGAILLAAFVAYELRVSEPLIDIPTALLPSIRLTNAATLFAGFGFFGFATILSQFFQEPTSTGYGPGASATQAGLFLVPGLLVFTVVSPLAGRLSARVGPVFTFRVGLFVCTLGLAGLTLGHSHQLELYLWPVAIYSGLAASFGAMPTIILQNVPPERSGQSSAINMILRTAGSAIGVQLAATIITLSIGPGGDPTENGYVAAFAVATCAGLIALVLAMAIPQQRRAAEPAPVAVRGPVA